MPKRKNSEHLSVAALKGLPCSNEYRYLSVDHAIKAFTAACEGARTYFNCCGNCLLRDKPCRAAGRLACFGEWAKLPQPSLLREITPAEIKAMRKELRKNLVRQRKDQKSYDIRTSRQNARREAEYAAELAKLDKLEAALKKSAALKKKSKAV